MKAIADATQSPGIGEGVGEEQEQVCAICAGTGFALDSRGICSACASDVEYCNEWLSTHRPFDGDNQGAGMVEVEVEQTEEAEA